MGTHDMGWAERTVFGKIRYMNYQGCKRKFDIQKFVANFPAAATSSSSSVPPAKKKARTK